MRETIGKFLKNVIGGHMNIGKRLTIYGDNAMHFGVTFWTRRYGYICFRLPIPCGIVDFFRYGDRLHWRPLYLYISRNATPWASVFFVGKKHSKRDWALARVRKCAFGWKYDCDNEYHYERLRQINNSL